METRSHTPIRTGLFVLAFALFAPVAFGQMPQGNMKTLSSEDVSDEQVKKTARIAIEAQMSTQKERMQMRREMKQKYGNPQQMDSTQKANARREMRKRQMAMRKKQMAVMKKKAAEENMEFKMVRQILRSARQDSTLGKRLKQAMKAEMKNRRPQMGPGSQSGGGQGGGSQ